ncbi:uncharacterized protein EI97DRAFT_138219 [Westerdykella ornata]|uniref:C2H2-type domain-containing protein n=1 Tax=Westerdykella ornata TaxID=318751 RepID=A0A6A6JCA0_WESOR|nr:uncharacterized protein EI97DRAFT_138219 [Westerdykella ornata]KAF2273905.1 hypothetical protein EI97DRAFT_138219 [Westerdykella ornata]
MLSTNAPSSIQRRTVLHRRQNSTPAAFEGPTVRPLPTNLRQQRQHRSGMSLDLRGLNLEAKVESPLLPGGDSTVSNTNLGQPQQHFMQVAQPHSQPQPGLQDAFVPSPVQQSLPSPRTPHRSLNHDRSQKHLSQTPQRLPQSPTKTPSEEEVKELQRHIQSVYGSYAQVFINILPTPAATPQKPSRLANQLSAEPLPALMSSNFGDITTVNLEPTPSAMTFDFENPDAEVEYDSSSYYTSDALSPSPASSPRQKTIQTSLEDIKEEATQEMSFSQPPALLPSAMAASGMGMPSFVPASPLRAPLPIELELNATLEYTGISPEEVQRYISEQDPETGKWTCLYPDCGKVFGRRENIRSHVQTHLGDRQYRCNGCGKCFVRQHDLKRHAKIHSGVKSYKCPCGAGFARQDALTRHRQRGMCVGGFPDAVRRPAKRGRPKKNRPGMEERVSKAAKTRRALASAASSISAGSPQSDSSSAGNSPPSLDEYENPGLQKLLSGFCSFDDSMNVVSDPFTSYSTSTSFDNSTDIQPGSLEAPLSFANDTVSSASTKQDISRSTHTPPMSPADPLSITNCTTTSASNPQSTSNAIPTAADSFQANIDPALKAPSTPSRSSIHSNPFSTPPTSPVEPKDPLDGIDMFGTITDGSQFELEMKAMGESEYSVGLGGLESGIGASGYEFLNFDL